MVKRRVFLVLVVAICVLGVSGKRGGGGGSFGRRGSSRGSSSTPGTGGWFSGWFGKSGANAPAAIPKPVASIPSSKPSAGWSNPGKKDLPSQNIGPGGYPVQKGNLSPPPYSATNPHGTAGQTRVGPPAYHSPYGAPPAYHTGPHTPNSYHYAAPPAYSASHYGMPSSYNPPRNNFGYSGGYYGNSQPTYGGMGLFSSGNNYGYSGSGMWGNGISSYGAQRRSSSTGSFLMGAASGYMASSLINRLTNPWGYHGYGYGHGYMNHYRSDRKPSESTPSPLPEPTNNWINCVAFDPITNNTLVNPNCTCTVTTTLDEATGQNITHHDCTPPAPVQNQPTAYGVNNPPPTYTGSLYGDGSSYGGGYPTGPPVAETGALTDEGVKHRRSELFSQIERIVNMGRFAR